MKENNDKMEENNDTMEDDHDTSMSPMIIPDAKPPKIIADTKSSKLSADATEAAEEKETDLITYNVDKVNNFRRLGFFLIQWKKTKYEISNRRLLLFYLLTYFGAFVIFGLSYGIREIFKRKYNHEYLDQIDDLIEASFVGLILGMGPACWNYLLREYSTHLPIILLSTKKMEKTEIYKELEISKNPKLSYNEGWKDEDHNDIEDEVNIETEKSLKEQWWIVKNGPSIGILLAVAVMSGLVIANLVVNVSDIFVESNDNTLKHLIKDLPAFIASTLYPIPCFVGIWFCIFFLEWQRRIYSSLRTLIRDIKKENFDPTTEVCDKLNEKSKEKLEKICYMLVKLQKVFALLNKRIFQKTIVVNFSLFIFLDVYCSWKVIQDHTNYIFIVPLLLINVHTYVLCKWSSDLMAEFNEIMEVLNEMHEDDVEHIRREFNEYPPQVMAFGGFSVDYSMMTAVLAFALSIISISGMIWPELGKVENQKECFIHTEGGWNTTICVKQHCYQYGGENNYTMCLREALQETGAITVIPITMNYTM